MEKQEILVPISNWMYEKKPVIICQKHIPHFIFKPICNTVKQIPFLTTKLTYERKMMYSMKCHVKKVTQCWSFSEEKCSEIELSEFNEKPYKICKKSKVVFPWQKFEQKCKCLINKEKK